MASASKFEPDEGFMEAGPPASTVGSEPSILSSDSDPLWSNSDDSLSLSFAPCWKDRIQVRKNKSWGFVMVECYGGAENHMAQIGDAAVVAFQLGASLLVPRTREEDLFVDSNFSSLYDVSHFIQSFHGIVRVVGNMPKPQRNMEPLNITVPRDVSAEYIETHIRPLFTYAQIIKITSFSPRISETLDKNDPLQAIRCLVSYQALKFGPGVLRFGTRMVERMREAGGREGGKFIAIDLYQGTFKKEKCFEKSSSTELSDGTVTKTVPGLFSLTEDTEQLRVAIRRQRRHDKKCPFSPLDIGKFLKALGFPNETAIYLTVEKSHPSLEPLRAMYPNLLTKEYTVPHLEEQQLPTKSVLAMLVDFHVCKGSSVFMPATPGLFRNSIIGQRLYENRGVLKPSSLSTFDVTRLTCEQEARLIKALHGFNAKGPVLETPKTATVSSNPEYFCLCQSGAKTGDGSENSAENSNTGSSNNGSENKNEITVTDREVDVTNVSVQLSSNKTGLQGKRRKHFRRF